MKKLKLVFLSVLVVMCSWLFSACFEKEIKTDGIQVSESSITLRLNESVDIDVQISPNNATNKSFELFGYNQNIVSVQSDVKNSKFTITANSQIINDETHTTVGVRTADGTYREAYIEVDISSDEENVSTPRNFAFDGEKFVWDEVDEAKAYTISINQNEYIISKVNNELPTFYNVSIKDYEGQEVVAKIKANGKSKNLDSNFSEECRFNIFEEPKNVKFRVNLNSETNLEEKILSWDEVENAVSYSILINDRVIETTESTIDISEYLIEALDYQIKVKTNTDFINNNFNSAYTDAIAIKKLPAPSNLGIINGILRWNSVNALGAIGYEVYYTYKLDGISYEKTENITTSNFRLPFDVDTGIYLAKVRAIGDNKTTLTSDFGFEVSYTKLDAVNNIRLENGNVVWDSTRYATSYKVFLTNMIDESGDTQSIIVLQNSDALQVSLDVSSFGTGDYRIQIQAVGTDDKVASNLSEPVFNFTKLATPSNLQAIKEDDVCKVQWNSVKNANGYKVFLDEEEPYFIPATNEEKVIFQFPANAIKVGNNLVSVMAMGGNDNGMNCVNSEITQQITITKLNTPTLITTNLKSGKLAWNSIGGATSYKVEINALDESEVIMPDLSALTITNLDFNSAEYNLPAGEYSIVVKANASTNQNVFDSDFSQSLLVCKLPVEIDNKKLYVENGSIQDLENTEDYSFEYLLTDSNNVQITRSNISEYIGQNLNGGAKISIQVKAVPKQTKNQEDFYLISSELSQKLYIQRLPNLADLHMIDGVLYYGNLYDTYSSFEFVLTLNDSENNETIINNQTNTNYSFINIEAGDYTVKVQANSVQTGSGISSNENSPMYLNSYISNSYSFKKLAIVEDLAISSFANDYSDELWNTIYSFDVFENEYSGSIVWSAIESARSYELRFSNGISIITTNLCESLQNSAIGGGQNLTVKIRALGNNENIISGEYTNESVEFTKFYAPQTITVTHDNYGNKVLKWTYASGQDPNSELSSNMLSDIVYNFSGLNRNISQNLFDSNLTIAIHVIIDDAGRLYPAIDYESANPEYENDLSDILYALKSNQCRLPASLRGNTTLKVFAIPLNSYIYKSGTFPTAEEISKITANTANKRNIMSDFSPEVFIECLQTPGYLGMEENIISWSPLFYNDNQKAQDALSEYRVYITNTETKEQKIFSIKKTGSTSSIYPTIFVDSLTNPENCIWIFNKSKFENLFGANSYVPNVYSVCVQAISTNVYYTVGNKTIYYADSPKSSSINIEVLDNPELSLEKGILKWTKVSNVDKYGLYITKPNSQTVYIEFENDINEFDLQGEEYPSGQYKFQIISVGDGQKTITSQKNNSPIKTFTKLSVVENLKLQNGIIKYSSHTVVSASNQCEYTMFIRSENQTKDKEYSNAKYDTFELASGSDFPGGQKYYIRVRATGDNNNYINSELTNYLYIDQNQTLPTKFETPTNLKIENGKLIWNRVSGITNYLINISGGEYSLDAERMGDSYDFATVPAGTYTVQVKAIGNNVYLNSSSAQKTNVKKLSDIKELKLENGYIVWKNESSGNYKLSINGQEKFIDSENAEIENGYIKYRLVGFDEGIYNLFIQNFGGNSAISSSQTQTLSFEKLVAPSNLMIENELFYFSSVDYASNYQIDISAKLANGTVKTIKYVPETISSYDNEVIENKQFKKLPFSILHDEVKQVVGTAVINEYQLSVIAIGDSLNSDDINTQSTYYITSNDSVSLIINKPEAPVLSYETDETNRFFGKIYWNEVDGADYYKVYVDASQDSHKVLFGYDISQARTDNENGHDDYNYFIVSGKTYANVAYMDDNYSFIVVACKNKDGYDSENSNVWSGLIYNLFDSSSNGSDENPYEIATEYEFNAIKYNLAATYRLNNQNHNLVFTQTPNVLGTENTPFTGKFDGQGYELCGNNGNLVIDSKNSTFNGLFGYIGNNAVVQNFVFSADIYATTQNNNKIEIGMIAVKNYGTISNVVTNGIISTEFNSDTFSIYNAGIVVHNFGQINSCLSSASVAPKNNLNDVYAGGICNINGTEDNVAIITKTGFIGNATGQFAAGIATENYGNISECYFETDSKTSFILSQNRGTTANFAGGLVAYMHKGLIEYSYVYGKISGTTNSSEIAYVGGFVGYLIIGEIKNSFVIGYNNNEILISATGTQSNTIKVGVIAGTSERKNICTNVLYVKADNQKVVGSGSITGAEEQSLSTLKDRIEKFQSNYFDLTNSIPKLRNARYKEDKVYA